MGEWKSIDEVINDEVDPLTYKEEKLYEELMKEPGTYKGRDYYADEK